MSEMVERVVQAIDAAGEPFCRIIDGEYIVGVGDDLISSHRWLYEAKTAQQKLRKELKARAAIEAMREPTEAMMAAVDCGGEKKTWLSGAAWYTGYQRMIEGALK